MAELTAAEDHFSVVGNPKKDNWELPLSEKPVDGVHDPLGDCTCSDCTLKAACISAISDHEEAIDKMAVLFTLDSCIDFIEELVLTGDQLKQAGQLLRDIEALRLEL